MGQDRTERPTPRRTPVQQRSAERLERILGSAKDLIAESGAEALKMNELAQRAGISIGSLYQYFPDRSAVVAALALRFNAEGQACVRNILTEVASPGQLADALCAVVDGYYRMFLAEPVMRDIWAGALADRSLQSIDEEDCRIHGALIADAMSRATPGDDGDNALRGRLASVLVSAVVRHALTETPDGAEAALDIFKRKIIPALATGRA